MDKVRTPVCLLAFGILLLVTPLLVVASPLGTAFTYQGRLLDDDSPANGLYDFEFKLYDAVTDGNQLSTTVYEEDVDVNDGDFMVDLDFGSDPNSFNGQARWLATGVRPGASTGSYTPLGPRQELTPAPYALYSASTVGIDVNDTDGYVGIGTDDPQAKLHIDSSVSGIHGEELLRLSRESTGIGLRLLNFNGADVSFTLQYDPWNTTDWFDLMSFSTYGRIGIGTTTPTHKLQVVGTRIASGKLNSSDTGDIGGLDMYASTDYADRRNWTIRPESTNLGMLGFWVSPSNSTESAFAAQVMGISKEGDVGIGTTSPDARLHVAKSNSSGIEWVGWLHNPYAASDMGGTGTGLKLKTYTAGIHPNKWTGIASESQSSPTYGKRVDQVFYTVENADVAAPTEKMRITGPGRVGIGTNAPSYALDILGGQDSTVRTYGPGNPGFWAVSSDSSMTTVFRSHGGVNLGLIGTISNHGFAIYANNVNRMHFDTSGNVGIGTTTPQGKLDVNGSIYQRGSVLHADYVFEPDYELESIDEHAAFMWEKKHLQAIPARRVDAEGQEIIEVGAHQRGIVEELEKAHIYIEQLHRRLDDVESQRDSLEARLDKLEAVVRRLDR